MNFTPEQFEALAPFERYFHTAVESKYASYVGFRNAEKIWNTLQAAGVKGVRPNFACGQCVFRLVKQAGTLWFQDRAELDRLAAEELDRKAREAAAEQKTLDVPGFEDVVVHEGNIPVVGVAPVEECDENTPPKPKKTTKPKTKKK